MKRGDLGDLITALISYSHHGVVLAYPETKQIETYKSISDILVTREDYDNLMWFYIIKRSYGWEAIEMTLEDKNKFLDSMEFKND